MSCNPILSGFARSIESHSGDYGSIFSFQRHQSGATNRRYDIMQQTHDRSVPIHAYDGEEKAKNELSKLAAKTIPGTIFVAEQQSLLCGINGKKFDNDTRELYLIPGTYKLCVRYFVPGVGLLGSVYSTHFDEELEISVEAGLEYELEMKLVKGGMMVKDVHYMLIGHNGKTVATTEP